MMVVTSKDFLFNHAAAIDFAVASPTTPSSGNGSRVTSQSLAHKESQTGRERERVSRSKK